MCLERSAYYLEEQRSCRHRWVAAACTLAPGLRRAAEAAGIVVDIPVEEHFEEEEDTADNLVEEHFEEEGTADNLAAERSYHPYSDCCNNPLLGPDAPLLRCASISSMELVMAKGEG